MSGDGEWVSYDTQDEALASVLPGLEAGERVTVHDGGCAVEDGEDCDCDVLVVYGPSGQA